MTRPPVTTDRRLLALENAPDGLLVHDAEGRFLEANPAACRLLGYERDVLLTLSMSDIEKDFDRYGIKARWAALEVGESLTSEGVPTRGDGQEIQLEVRLTVMSGPDGEREFVCVLRDTSHRRSSRLALDAALRNVEEVNRRLAIANSSLEEKLEEARIQVVRSERLATLGTLAAGVGHELKNLAGVARFISDEMRQQPDTAHLERDVVLLFEHLRSHATHLLEFGRRTDHAGEEVEVGNVVDDVVDLLRSAGRTKGARIRSEIDSAHWVGVGRTGLEQVLVNLLANAADAARLVDPPGEIVVSAERVGDLVRCTVHDTGPGMDRETLDRAFEPFFTTKGAAEGTGMGLPVAKQIVEEAGGRIQLRSEPGRGTLVTLDLPGAGPRGPEPTKRRSSTMPSAP